VLIETCMPAEMHALTWMTREGRGRDTYLPCPMGMLDLSDTPLRLVGSSSSADCGLLGDVSRRAAEQLSSAPSFYICIPVLPS
jgi:hypothetical protein